MDALVVMRGRSMEPGSYGSHNHGKSKTGRKKNNFKCYKDGKPGHFKKDCRDLNTSNPQGNVSSTSEDGNALCCEAAVAKEGKRDLHISMYSCNDHELKIIGIRSIMVMHDGTVRTIRDVRHIMEKVEALIASHSPSHKVAVTWHQKLGHMSEHGMKILVERKLFPGLTKKCFCFGIGHFDMWLNLILERRSKCLRTDNRGEYTYDEFDTFCRKEGIKRPFTIAYTPQYNGVAEWMNITLLERARAILSRISISNSWSNGMNQDVHRDVARVNGSRKIAWRFYTMPVKDVKVYIPSRVFKPYVTVRYLEWWNKSAGECSMQSPFGDNVTRNFGKNESRSKRSKVSPKHTKPFQPTHTCAPLLKPSAVKSKPCSFNHSSSSKTSTSKVSFNGFRTLLKGWKDWVNSMHSLHKSMWQKAGIYNAVLNSSYEIIKDDDLILQFAKKWCDETNTFVFKWGEVTITLQDMMVVGGSFVLGQSVVNLADTEIDESKAIIAKLNETRVEMKRSSYTKAEQSGWMKMFKDSGSEIEHEAFLVLWLSRFVLPSTYTTITKKVFAITVSLGRGVKLTLAPPVLASIYRDLWLLKYTLKNDDQNDVIVWAPLQLLQVWIWERFKILSPNCGDSSGPRFARWEKKKLSVENVDCGLGDFSWQPYAEDSYDNLGRWAAVGDWVDEELESWVRFIRVSELVGIDGKCIEQYLPHRVAMQFGMNQDVPGDVARVNESPELAWRFYTRPVKDVEVYFPTPISKPYVTARYLKWWNKSNGEGHLQSPIDVDKIENFGKDESKK
ncbi:aminotransferase-like mobile domain-containing protein [Tanacetum coccineum]